jgi:hypothetical protein
MPAHRLLLASTALSGLVEVPPLEAAEVLPGGALNLTLSGFARFLVNGGDTDDFLLNDDLSREPDFFNDTEVHFNLRGTDETSGLQYGATVEFEADTNATANTDETWIFLKGGFGEVRLGDEDGAADADGIVKGPVDAVRGIGTDGIEGDEWEEFIGSNKLYEPRGTNDATKIRYYTPSFGGFMAGISYTPNLSDIGSGADNGDSLATTDVEAGDVVEGGVQYDGELGGLGVGLSLTGLYGDVENEDAIGGDDYNALQAGGTLALFGAEFGASYLTEEVGGTDLDAVAAAISYDLSPLLVGVSGGYALDTDDLVVNDNEVDHPWLVILSATYLLAPGLTLDGDLGYFDNDVENAENPDGDGVRVIGRLGLTF